MFEQGAKVMEAFIINNKPNSYISLRVASTTLLHSRLVYNLNFTMKQAIHKQKEALSIFSLNDATHAHIEEVLWSTCARNEMELDEENLSNSNNDGVDGSGSSDDSSSSGESFIKCVTLQL